MSIDTEAWKSGYEACKKSKEDSLSAGTACFLIKDVSLKDMNAEFYTWLRRHGFTHGEPTKGYYDGVSWVYVNLNSKKYGPGMPGISLTEVVCNHTITIDEFMTIYGIFEKYEGKPPLEF